MNCMHEEKEYVRADIVYPSLLDEEEWDCLCGVYASYVNVEFKMLLVGHNPYKAEMPSRNAIHAPAVLTGR